MQQCVARGGGGATKHCLTVVLPPPLFSGSRSQTGGAYQWDSMVHVHVNALLYITGPITIQTLWKGNEGSVKTHILVIIVFYCTFIAWSVF